MNAVRAVVTKAYNCQLCIKVIWKTYYGSLPPMNEILSSVLIFLASSTTAGVSKTVAVIFVYLCTMWATLSPKPPNKTNNGKGGYFKLLTEHNYNLPEISENHSSGGRRMWSLATNCNTRVNMESKAR